MAPSAGTVVLELPGLCELAAARHVRPIRDGHILKQYRAILAAGRARFREGRGGDCSRCDRRWAVVSRACSRQGGGDEKGRGVDGRRCGDRNARGQAQRYDEQERDKSSHTIILTKKAGAKEKELPFYSWNSILYILQH